MPPSPTPWPDHWYHHAFYIRCIVPHCPFFTASDEVEPQWTEMFEHCSATSGPEHDLLQIMLQQSTCAIDDCNPRFIVSGSRSYRTRMLCRHEKDVHGSAEMSNICSFVRLAREGRIRRGRRGAVMEQEPNCERLAFFRMMEEVQALPAAELELLFRKSGFHPGQYTPNNLRWILTHDPLAQPDENPPYWWPVRAEDFLSFCRPHPPHPNDQQSDYHWRVLWRDLRAMYARGRI